jgi:hypothetical protein
MLYVHNTEIEIGCILDFLGSKHGDSKDLRKIDSTA